MSINEIWLDDFQYRYSFHQCENPHASYGVFLLGTLQEIESMQFFCSEFSNVVNLFVVEVPGTGLTNPLPATFSMQDQSKMLVTFLEKMGIVEAHIMSISYATPIAVELCANWKGALSLSMCGGMLGVAEELRLEKMALLHDAVYNKQNFARKFINGLTINDPSIPRGKIIACGSR